MKTVILAAFFLVLAIFFPTSTFAQQAPSISNSYMKGEVISIQKEGFQQDGFSKNYFQDVTVRITQGSDKNKQIAVEYGGLTMLSSKNKLVPGDIVVVQKSIVGSKTTYSILDRYRLDIILWIIGGFLTLVVIIAGRKGLGSIIGMLISLAIIMGFIVPQILAGHDPLTISIIGALVIMLITIYLAHGFSKQTTIAVISTGLVLMIAGALAVLFVHGAQLTGNGNEDSSMLQFGTSINLQGLLLGGIIIGALGVLDDVTTAQVAAVFELAAANPHTDFLELIQKGHRIGKEHIASLVNTLVLAYAGASLAIFIFFVLNPGKQPYWVIFNSQSITEEIVRTLAGSISLVLAVPLSTVLAAWVVTKKKS